MLYDDCILFFLESVMAFPQFEIFHYNNSPKVIVVVRINGVHHFLQPDGTLGRNRFRFLDEVEARKAIKVAGGR